MLDKFFKIKTIYNNYNQVVNEEDNFLLFIELINVFESISFSSHYLKLKNDCIIIMLRNLQQIKGFYNETRLYVKHIEFKILDYRIFENEHNDKQHYVSRISLTPPDSNNLYILFRRIQCLIHLIFNITIIKSQD